MAVGKCRSKLLLGLAFFRGAAGHFLFLVIGTRKGRGGGNSNLLLSSVGCGGFGFFFYVYTFLGSEGWSLHALGRAVVLVFVLLGKEGCVVLCVMGRDGLCGYGMVW